MKLLRAIIPLIIMTACYTKEDALEQLEHMGRPKPIKCVNLNSGGDEIQSYICTDGARVSWACDHDGCIEWVGK